MSSLTDIDWSKVAGVEFAPAIAPVKRGRPAATLEHKRKVRRDYEAARRLAGLCQSCPNLSGGRWLCPACTKARGQAARARRLAAGLCIRCGGVTQCPGKQCTACLESLRTYRAQATGTPRRRDANVQDNVSASTAV